MRNCDAPSRALPAMSAVVEGVRMAEAGEADPADVLEVVLSAALILEESGFEESARSVLRLSFGFAEHFSLGTLPAELAPKKP